MYIFSLLNKVKDESGIVSFTKLWEKIQDTQVESKDKQIQSIPTEQALKDIIMKLQDEDYVQYDAKAKSIILV